MTAYVQFPDGLVIKTDTPQHHRDGTRLSAVKGKAALKAHALVQLHKMLKPNATVQCVIRSVSRSGMSRHIDFYTVGDGELCYLTGYIADALDYRQAKDGSLVVGGCGMDMGFAVVYELGHVMWPKGTPEPHGRRNGEPDSDGGYALKHRWV